MMNCNICGHALHMGCCNPSRPAVESGDHIISIIAPSPFKSGWWENEAPPIALTDAHVQELERAIRAEGYRILIDPDRRITLEKLTDALHSDGSAVTG